MRSFYSFINFYIYFSKKKIVMLFKINTQKIQVWIIRKTQYMYMLNFSILKTRF